MQPDLDGLAGKTFPLVFVNGRDYDRMLFSEEASAFFFKAKTGSVYNVGDAGMSILVPELIGLVICSLLIVLGFLRMQARTH